MESNDDSNDEVRALKGKTSIKKTKASNGRGRGKKAVNESKEFKLGPES